jgi:hypothetical protein
MTPTDFAKIPTPRTDAILDSKEFIKDSLSLCIQLERELFIAEKALTRLSSSEAFDMPRMTNEEDRQRLEFARETLRLLEEVRKEKG